jgi:ABC-type spermidine/putrescine transport system permease subunit II
MTTQEVGFPKPRAARFPIQGMFVMAVLLIGFGFWIIYPIFLTLLMSFNAAPLGLDPVWTLGNWSTRSRTRS